MMTNRIDIMTSDGPKNYLFIKDSSEYQQALDSGEIVPGMELVYREYLVYVLDDNNMGIIETVLPQIQQTMFGCNPMNTVWEFTANGE